MTSSAQARSRWLLHPLSVAIVLLVAGAGAAFMAATSVRDLAAAGALLVAVAGAAAGFANSGST